MFSLSLALSTCCIKSDEEEKKSLYLTSTIAVTVCLFLTFTRLLSLLYTQLTTTKTAAAIVVAGPMIIGN